MRYRFYREHKFISAALSDVERLFAQTDFCDDVELKKAEAEFAALANMLTMHAQYENDRIHNLLRIKNSSVHVNAEIEHEQQHASIDAIKRMLDEIRNLKSADEKIEKSYDLYLAYRKFFAENLLHLHEEETLILAELQRNYTDDELQSVAAIAYNEMTPDDMMHMAQGLFPHMNKHDRHAFLTTMHKLVPKKYKQAWPNLQRLLSDDEKKALEYLIG